VRLACWLFRSMHLLSALSGSRVKLYFATFAISVAIRL
jgi:hypothetical protein